MPPLPHPDSSLLSIRCAVLTISDTRTSDSDRSGQFIQQVLQAAGHYLESYQILPDDPNQIQAALQQLGSMPELDVILCNGGTGISPRDNTYERKNNSRNCLFTFFERAIAENRTHEWRTILTTVSFLNFY
jgi:molybdenum cofactor biosynthesis protein B